MKKYSDEALFCVRYLKEKGYLDESVLPEIEQAAEKATKVYAFTEIKYTFFRELAENLRKLWPAGEKDGKYPWLDSVDNLESRLEVLWKDRGLREYTMDECLTAARRYLSQFEDNAKFMQTLKYFILKQSKVTQKDGRVRYVNESKFADLLEGQSSQEIQAGWEAAFEEVNNNYYDQGYVI